MADNPLVAGAPQSRGKVTEAQLHAHAESLNSKYFVRNSGKPYFVNSRTDDNGVAVHFLDRST